MKAEVMSPVLAPGSTIGILGGGQLGRMLALSAARLGLKSHIYAQHETDPALDVAASNTIADWNDESALTRFAEAVDAVTFEFENIPLSVIDYLAARVSVRPGRQALAMTQDRLVEKEFLNSLGIATAPYVGVDDAGALARVIGQMGRPAILKTRRFGYDGKGQVFLRDGTDIGAAFRTLGGVPAILEGVVPFVREISVVAARGPDGAFRAWDVCENEHARHILATTRLPATISATTQTAAPEVARKIADALGYVGVIAVEMFVVVADGAETLIVNEIAPRVHNSGHWTLDGSTTSQFEQHMRAVAGWPLGSADRHGRIEMRNLIGDEADSWQTIAAEAGACLHLYGKIEARPGRKMGHVTTVFHDC